LKTALLAAMNRRKFCLGLGTIGLSGCQLISSPNSLTIGLISGIIPGKFIQDFSRQNKIKLLPKLNKNYDKLLTALAGDEPAPSIFTIGDSWLTELKISLHPLDPKLISNWSLVPPKWRSVGERNGQLLGIPFRWGTTVIVYNQNKFKRHNIPPITSWQDLWHPLLKRKISLPDNDREVIGLCLKKRGLSYNQMPQSWDAQLTQDLDTINQQVLTYTSNYYVQALVNEDTWACVGWSADFTEIVKRYPQLKVVHPQEGTALWFDCWVISQTLSNLDLAYKWFNYCLDPQNSRLVTLLTRGTGITDRDQSLPSSYLDRCEPILPLPPAAEAQYQQVWQQLRQKT
jgi:putative spermidine/putrescine transport system substrate-binding protein